MNRASYQRINPNMSLKPATKPKQPVLMFKDVINGNVIFKELTTNTLHQIAKTRPDINGTQVLIDLVKGKSFHLTSFSVTLVYKQ